MGLNVFVCVFVCISQPRTALLHYVPALLPGHYLTSVKFRYISDTSRKEIVHDRIKVLYWHMPRRADEWHGKTVGNCPFPVKIRKGLLQNMPRVFPLKPACSMKRKNSIDFSKELLLSRFFFLIISLWLPEMFYSRPMTIVFHSSEWG